MHIVNWVWTTIIIFYSFLDAAFIDAFDSITWCTVSAAEQRKCVDFSRAVNRTTGFLVALSCQQTADKDKCLDLIDTGRADLVTLDPGQVYVAGRYNSLVPVMTERYGADKASGYYAVVVARESLAIRTLSDLKGTKACFPGIGPMAGWLLPMSVLIEKGILAVTDCNNMIKNAAAFFGPSCLPSSLIDKYNPTGDNPIHLCNQCAGDKNSRCTLSDPYANFDGAFNCLANGSDIAFLRHTTVDEMLSSENYRGLSGKQFKLVCPTGLNADVESYETCNWGYVPAHSVVTTSAVHPDRKKLYQSFLAQSALEFGSQQKDNAPRWNGPSSSAVKRSFSLFGHSEVYGGRDLLFLDSTTDLYLLKENQQTFDGNVAAALEEPLHNCPVPAVRLCVVSTQEMKKCNRMRVAFKTQSLRPDLVCVKGFGPTGCMKMLSENEADLTVLDAGDIYQAGQCMKMLSENSADLTVLDAGDIYQAGQRYNLMPIIAEQYDLDEPVYYAVAVALQKDKSTDLLNLKGKRSCHSGMGTAAGWIMPMSFLLSSKRMRSYACDSPRAAASFFQKSCIPGALSHTSASTQTQLCDLCHGTSSHFCAKSTEEPFFGHTGALRCLVEGGGEVAFVKHTTVAENTAGRNLDLWSRPMMPSDFELLCRDGARAKWNMFEKCNFGKVSANAMVAREGNEHVSAYVDLFLLAQQYFGSKYSDEFTFKLFASEGVGRDLIFQDAAQELKVVPESKRDFREYLGHEFVQAVKVVDCTASAFLVKASLLNVVVVFLGSLVFSLHVF